MKKITTLVIAMMLSVITFSQKTYIAKQTQIYKWNDKKSEWQFSSANKDVTIPISIFKRFIHIQAKENAYFLLDENPVEISRNTFKGYSYTAYEFVTESNCEIHIIDSDDGESMISIVWFTQGINIRYYFQ